MDTRESTLTREFVDHADRERIVSNRKLRRFTVGALNTCRSMGLSLFLPAEPGTAPPVVSDVDKEQQAMAFFWAQSAPIDEVLDHVDAGTWKRAVTKWCYDIDIAAIPLLLAEIRRISFAAGEAAVDVVERSKTPGGEEPPGN